MTKGLITSFIWAIAATGTWIIVASVFPPINMLTSFLYFPIAFGLIARPLKGDKENMFIGLSYILVLIYDQLYRRFAAGTFDSMGQGIEELVIYSVLCSLTFLWIVVKISNEIRNPNPEYRFKRNLPATLTILASSLITWLVFFQWGRHII